MAQLIIKKGVYAHLTMSIRDPWKIGIFPFGFLSVIDNCWGKLFSLHNFFLAPTYEGLEQNYPGTDILPFSLLKHTLHSKQQNGRSSVMGENIPNLRLLLFLQLSKLE